MNKLEDIKHLKPGDMIVNLDLAEPKYYTVIGVNPIGHDIVYLYDVCGRPISLHEVTLETQFHNWYENYTEIDIVSCRMLYYHNMKYKMRKEYQRLLEIQSESNI